MNARFKNILSFLLRLGLSAGLLIFLFSKIDVAKTKEVLKASDINFLLIALLVFFSIYGIILARWFVFIRALGLHSPLPQVTRYFFIGLFGNLFLPSSIGGDIIKIFGLCRNSDQKPKVVASVLLDRLSGYAGLVVVSTIAFIFGYRAVNDVSLVIAIFTLACVWLGVMTILFNEKIYSACCRVFHRVPKARQALMNMHHDIALLDSKAETFLKTIGLSCLAQITLAIVFYLTAKALHQNIIFIPFLIFVPLICVASAFPSIGGLGVREAGAAYLFAKIGIEAGVAVSISLINFLFMVIVGLIGGVVYVSTVSSGRLQYHQSDPGFNPKKA